MSVGGCAKKVHIKGSGLIGADEGVILFFVSYVGVRTVARVKGGVVGEGVDFFSDGAFEGVEAAAREVCSADRVFENDVTYEGCVIGLIIKDNGARGMTWCGSDFELDIGESKGLTVVDNVINGGAFKVEFRGEHGVHGGGILDPAEVT